MRRHFGLHAKIGIGFHQSNAKNLVPNTIDCNSRDQGILVADQPHGKLLLQFYHGDHTRLRVDLLGNDQFILKVPNSSNRMDIKEGREINIGWNSVDCRALDPK